ncbi:MAG TPA: hypothetical protein VLA19_04110 [Herpetosiphonaceae bacterium]|nr:hypothetical protein [Herpetosiphonaceae bacterium]
MSNHVRGFMLLLALSLVAGCGSPSQPGAGPTQAGEAETAATLVPPQEDASPEQAGISPGQADISPGEGSASSGSCVEVYSAETLKNRSFAFDGTITAVEPRPDPSMGGDGQGEGPTMPWATFKVNRWYKGGSGGEAGVWLQGAQTGGADAPVTSAGSITAEVGTRLLVAGEPIGVGDAPEQWIAWVCGFTQPYTAEAAAAWEAAAEQ